MNTTLFDADVTSMAILLNIFTRAKFRVLDSGEDRLKFVTEKSTFEVLDMSLFEEAAPQADLSDETLVLTKDGSKYTLSSDSEKRDDGTVYGTTGLLWKCFGRAFCNELAKDHDCDLNSLHELFDQTIIQSVDDSEINPSLEGSLNFNKATL